MKMYSQDGKHWNSNFTFPFLGGVWETLSTWSQDNRDADRFVVVKLADGYLFGMFET